ncbi:1-acylglycerol-3-phosphate O-acyltransferase [Halobacteriovorax sp. HLS]|uniref:1-acylglycerol-3-phosphate O-acyltransferase n=1 Tax=Halobacteriovorax sp. HLS TaxID=2234000 RepID=UPI000FDBB03C|nr:1-acylglycerol-3-phosphate O-acyltransferase [Halobacteriovorax sp. HLS]
MILKYTRFLLCGLLLAIVGIIGTAIGLLRPFNPGNVTIMAKMVKLGTYILGFKVITRDVEMMHEHHPGLFISNHQHNIDIFLASHILPHRTVSLGKKSLKWIPLFGQFYWLSGNVLIDRNNKRSAHGTMDQVAVAIKEKNTSIWMMPEGTRSHGRGVLPFKKGAFFTAINAQVDIMPICISSLDGNLDFTKLRSGTVIIQALPAVSTAGLTKRDVAQLTQDCHTMVKEQVKKLDAEIASMT